MQRGETSPVVAIGSTYPLFALIIFFFSGSSVAPFALAGVLLVALGLFLLHKPERGKISAHALFLGLGAAGVWGFWGYFDYRALEWGNAWDLMLWTFLFALSLSLLFGAVLFLWKGTKHLRIGRRGILYRLGASISSTLAVLAFYLALRQSQEPTSIIAITAAYPLVTMALTVLIGEESFYPKRLLAASVIVLGIIAIYL